MSSSLYLFINISKIYILILLTITLLSFSANAKHSKLPKFGKSSRHATFNEAQASARKNYDQKIFKDALPKSIKYLSKLLLVVVKMLNRRI